MANPKQELDFGQLQAAIDALTAEVKASPTDIQRRIFLFELLCFAGDYDRAERQLEVIGYQNVKAEIGVQAFHNNIKAERDRQRLFSNGLQPHFLTEPPAYVDLHLDAINRLREGNFNEARALLDQAEEERPALTGRLNGNQFDDFRDYDDVMGPVLELIVQNKYTWIPFEQIRRIEIPQPKQLRDLLWLPARVETTDATMGEIFLLTLYANSNTHEDDEVKLGRKTDWKGLSDDLYLGLGLRLFEAGGKEKPILEIRNIEFDSVSG